MKPFYILIVKNLKVTADGQAFYGTEYDMKEACPKCGTGARPVGPRYMSGLKITSKGIFSAGYGELLVDKNLAETLSAVEVKNLAAVHNSKKEKMPFFEIRGGGDLPPFSLKTTGYEIEAQCPFCKRDGYFNIPHVSLKLVYENIDKQLLKKEILTTYERFGNSRLRAPFKESGFARPGFVVSETIKNIFENQKIKGVEFVPVSILSTT